ncbi:hypothetical protein [Roseiconus lacunae]|uniref:hypothetical protein n=1 Tax=Roseiconus lacunae TaxID=2605694 RepID=UPI001E520C3C|nr:hypothetical protein [Roseiconus lacunae]MCD0459617.1 hypothetical protein [Roseiconus lacunae]
MSFQPFTVTCVTCGCRLSVRRESLVDRIVACPKCQSMVQLSKAAADAASPVMLGNRPVDSAALTKDSITSDSPELEPRRDSPAVDSPVTAEQDHPSGDDSPQPAAMIGSDPQPPASDETIAPPIVADDQLSTLDDGSAASDSVQDNTAAGPPLDWQSQTSAKSRRLAVIALSVIAGLLSIAILVTVLLRRGADDVALVDTTPPTADQTTADQTTQLPPSDDVSDDEQASPDADGNVIQEQGPAESSTATTESSSEADPAGVPNNAAETLPDPDRSISAVQASNDSATAAESMADSGEETATAIAPPADLLPQNPLLPENPLLPSNPLDSLKPGPAETSSNDEGPEAATLTELPDALKPFLLGMDTDRPHLPTNEPAPKSIDEIQLDQAADDDVKLEVMVDTPRPVNMTAAMGLTVAFQSQSPDGYPLADLALLISQMTGVPISLEWVSLDLVGTPIATKVPLPSGRWVSIEETLTSINESLGGVYEQQLSEIEIRPLDQRFAAVVSAAIDFSDLGEPESAIATARKLLRQTEDNPTEIQIPAEPGPQQLVVLVCEAIRRVRGQKGKVDDANLSRWAGTYDSQVERWPVLSGGKSGDVLQEPLAMASLVRRIAKENDVLCFVNWEEVAKRDLNPGSLLMPKTGPNVTAADAFAEVFEPEGLQVRQVDERHWWVGTAAYFDRLPVVVWFEDASRAEEYHRVASEVINGARLSQQFIGAVAVDPQSGRCLAVMPRFLLRQMPRLLKLAGE